jgi:flagellar biosynthesis/type III secretory pathway chaperone
MAEKLPGDKDFSQPNPEAAEFGRLESKRQAILVELKSLMDEEQRLIANSVTQASLDRLTEINRQEADLIDQLGVLEREITAMQGSK